MPDARICVVGGGAAGTAAALRAARLGAEVILVERDDLGGAWARCGAAPGAAVTAALRQGVPPPWPELRETARAAGADLRGRVAVELADHGVTVLAGDATLVGTGTVSVDTGAERVEVNAPTLVLAPGSEPARPGGLDFRDPRVIDASQLMALPDLPGRAVVIGGGPIAIGLADTLAGLGVRVVLAVPGDAPLADEEPRAVAALVAGLSAGGVQVVTGAPLEGAEADGGQLRVRLGNGTIHPADLVVAASGRVPGGAELDLAAAGVVADEEGFVAVDEHMHTGSADVYAVGDLLRGPAMSHLARAQGERAVEHALGAGRRRDLGTVPRVAWGRTALAAVGLTARRAESMGREVDVVANAPGAAVTAGRPSLALLTVDRVSGLVLGAAAVGDGAAELIAGVALPISWGCTAAELATVVPPGPGLAESLAEAAERAA